MQLRHGWLFPVMVLTALSVTAFGVLGIAAITGHLPLPTFAGSALREYSLTPAVVVQESRVAATAPQLAVPPEAAPVQAAGRLAQQEHEDNAVAGAMARN